MTSNTAGFPPAVPPPRVIDVASLVNLLDARAEVPVTYSFGGNAPTMVSIGHGTPFSMSGDGQYARLFVEFDPYGWVSQ